MINSEDLDINHDMQMWMNVRVHKRYSTILVVATFQLYYVEHTSHSPSKLGQYTLTPHNNIYENLRRIKLLDSECTKQSHMHEQRKELTLKIRQNRKN